jgi:hypothetical protein
MLNTKKSIIYQSRAAGLLYLLIIFFGMFSEVAVRSNLIVTGDADTTVNNIMENVWLFRVGFVSDAVMLLSDVAIAVLFYVLMKSINKTLAIAAAAFRMTQAAVLGFNLLNYYVALLLLNGTVYTNTFGAEQLHALAMLFLEMHSHGYDIGLLFFGISCLILGYLVIKSHYFPIILGYGLIASGVVYLTGTLIRFLYPGYISFISPIYIVPLVAELSFCLWLLVKGARIKPEDLQAA